VEAAPSVTRGTAVADRGTAGNCMFVEYNPGSTGLSHEEV
jgi:hypothetical protein